MKQDVVLDSLNVALLGADTMVVHTQRAAHRIQQAGSGPSAASSKPPLKFRFGHDIANHLLVSYWVDFLRNAKMPGL